MKKASFIFLFVILTSCNKISNNIEVTPQYSEKDLIPLNDSTKSLYYDDAAFIECGKVTKDESKRFSQVELNEDSILSCYNDLLYIYNNSFKIGNSFFEYAANLHSYATLTLYQFQVAVSKDKDWAANWKNGIKHTGLIEIDSLMERYGLNASLTYESDNFYSYVIKTDSPVNTLPLIDKFENTSDFLFVDPQLLVGGGSNISRTISGNYKDYKYNYEWGDCPSGCLNYHYWIIRIKDGSLSLIEEGGDPLTVHE